MTTIVGKISVFLLAENRLLREALAKILNKKTDITVVGSAPLSSGVVLTRVLPPTFDWGVSTFTTGSASRVATSTATDRLITSSESKNLDRFFPRINLPS